MKYLRAVSRIIIGLLFIFSGLTKAIDPVGTGFIMAEYFKAFGFSFLIPFSDISGALQSAVEFGLGVAVLIGLRMSLSSLLSMIVMLFFTFFTLYTAIFNPVSHCGCFGDAIRLSNMETFIKNLIFTPFAIFLYFQRKHFVPLAPKLWEWSMMFLFGAASLLLSLYCYRHLPLMEFTGFRTGNNIPEAMTIPEGAPQRQYQTTFTYQKGSETKTFTMDNLPDSDSGWSYVSYKTKLIQAGTIPEIPQFDVSTYKGNRYMTDSLLSIKGYLLVMSIPYADQAKGSALTKAVKLSQELGDLPFVVISGSLETHTSILLQAYGLDLPTYSSDPKTLYTMARA
ncbi:MAG: DoxX family protein, partial [Bacteroidetes bacterium]|nr:DoxX family protein [Bacteroidota bacterium]